MQTVLAIVLCDEEEPSHGYLQYISILAFKCYKDQDVYVPAQRVAMHLQ